MTPEIHTALTTLVSAAEQAARDNGSDYIVALAATVKPWLEEQK